MKKNNFKLLGLAGVLVVLMGGATVYLRPTWFGINVKPHLGSGHPLWITDVKDPRKLLGVANNAFVGKVISKEGTYKRELVIPETDFKVQILHNIKGQLPEFVVVNQIGGLDETTNTEILIENDQLLQPGMTYLFVTVAEKTGKYHALVSKYGDLPITNEQEQQKLITEFEEAYKNEIPYIMKDGRNLGIPYIQQQ
jgi:hypothetical protein